MIGHFCENYLLIGVSDFIIHIEIFSKIYCCFLYLQDHELGLLTEITHIQEIMHSLCLQASEPQSLPAASEQVLLDIKGDTTSFWNSQVTLINIRQLMFRFNFMRYF